MKNVAVQQSTRRGLRELALFAGSGGGILAAKLLGWETVCAVELELYRCLVLAQRQNDGILPAFPIWCGDVCDFDGRDWTSRIDVVSGGFPCQDISGANPSATGIEGARSGLWKQQLRILREAGHGMRREDKPLLWVENSPMLTSRGLGTVLGDLAELGYNARWGVLGADDVGGFHIRKRMFLVGYADRARLEGLPWNGDRDRGSDATGHATAAGVRVLADGARARSDAGTCEQVGAQGEEGRLQQSKRLGCCHVANTDRSREHEFQGSRPEVSERTGHGGDGCFWADAELLECRDGKIRAVKPGVCGMAHGIPLRVDRISALGDAQVPAVVAAAFQLLTKL